ncbi:metallophosphoesterase [Metaclostridioides mangenotii]|uniref:Phosphoesterase n=1 Tax=Metaclostridioides mangenotii TaxID=1540 RepID=A0ABS4EAH1_9FIRM|nr:metallophosphoesterase [Clostridioides mangenotii]MBP1854939.1 putative phosphoesterase [Clostridioides mangenotii]
MKVGIVSDTHRIKNTIDKAIEYLKDCSLILHAGDNFVDSKYINQATGIDIIAVKGNCDYENVEEELIFNIEDKKVFLCHGHKYNVKSGVESLKKKAKELDIDIVVFGHTHTPYRDQEDGILFLNPGSASIPRQVSYPSIVIMGINGEKVDVKEVRL